MSQERVDTQPLDYTGVGTNQIINYWLTKLTVIGAAQINNRGWYHNHFSLFWCQLVFIAGQFVCVTEISSSLWNYLVGSTNVQSKCGSSDAFHTKYTGWLGTRGITAIATLPHKIRKVKVSHEIREDMYWFWRKVLFLLISNFKIILPWLE